MQKKIFWTTFTLLGLLADIALPFWWACAVTLPILFASWWFAYRSDWFVVPALLRRGHVLKNPRFVSWHRTAGLANQFFSRCGMPLPSK